LQVVLAGDPRQLGPVLRSVHAIRHKLNISLLERLMGLPLYAKPYNSSCITKLVKNFRSHPKVSIKPKKKHKIF
jgi:helicase MOV-10